jgi:hypothetical protein
MVEMLAWGTGIFLTTVAVIGGIIKLTGWGHAAFDWVYNKKVPSKTATDNEGPWVGPVTTSCNPDMAGGDLIGAHVVIKNFGHTPAREMRAAFKGSIKPRSENPDPPDIDNAPRKTLFPNVPDWYWPFPKDRIISRPDFAAISDGYKVSLDCWPN